MTTLTESFNTADGTTIGPDLTWSELAADWSILSSQLRASAGTEGIVRADSDLASSDHSVTVTVATTISTTVQGGVTVQEWTR